MEELQEQVKFLKNKIAILEAKLAKCACNTTLPTPTSTVSSISNNSRLSNKEIYRYGRQLILPQFGPKGGFMLEKSG